MEFLIDLWLPILLGTVVLWFMSFFAWAVLPHHFGDNKKVPDEDGLMEYLKSSGLGAGNYFFPYAGSSKEQSDPEYAARYTEGPRGNLNLYDMPNMPSNMVQTILYFLVTVLTIGYVTHVACPPGAEGTDFMKVFRIAGTIGVLCYASSGFMHRIWFKARHWTFVVDGLAYGVVLGLIFGMLWPGGA